MMAIFWQTLYWLLSLLSAAISAALAVWLWRYRRLPDAKPLIILTLSVAFWCLAYAMEFQASDLAVKLWWVKLEYLGAVWVAPSFLCFALGISGLDHWLSPKRLILLGLIPLATILLVWSNPLHHLIWSRAWLNHSGPAAMVVYVRGLFFWIYILYSYLLLLAASALLIRLALKGGRALYRQSVLIVIGLITPWLANAVYLADLSPVPNLDLTPMAFAVSGIAFCWGLFRFQLLDIVPLARQALIEGMAEPLFVLDKDRRVVDLNPAARALVADKLSPFPAQPISQLLPGLPALPAAEGNSGAPRLELIWRQGSQAFDLHLANVSDKTGRPLGGLLLLRDVSRRLQAEEERILREKLQAAIETAGAACHELNQPLQAIVSQVELLLLSLPPDSPLRPKIEVLAAESEKMARITQRLMNLHEYRTRPYLGQKQILDLDKSSAPPPGGNGPQAVATKS